MTANASNAYIRRLVRRYLKRYPNADTRHITQLFKTKLGISAYRIAGNLRPMCMEYAMITIHTVNPGKLSYAKLS